MILIPYIRAGRAISSCLIYPENPVLAVSISEIISVSVPLLNPNVYNKLVGILLSMAYAPGYASFYLKWYSKTEKLYYISELIFLLLFCSFSYSLNYNYL